MDCEDDYPLILPTDKSGLTTAGIAGAPTAMPLGKGGITTRGKTKKLPEKRPKESTSRDIDSDEESVGGDSTRKMLASIHTILVSVQHNTEQTKNMVTALTDVVNKVIERQNNLELRVKNLQEARMAGLTAPISTPASVPASSGTTPHVGAPRGYDL